MTDTEFAPAKVNLTLHVTGRREDGYHLLDSLVTFASVGDSLSLRAASDLSLAITGPEAANLPLSDDNLVLRAARALGGDQGAELGLVKRLPVASGIGGGSADAAAALRGLARLWGLPLPDPAVVLGLGADVPVCLSGQSVRMSGVGESLKAVPSLPPVWAVMANPRVAVSTPQVFKALTCRDGAPMPEVIPAFSSAEDLAQWLAGMRNDLQPAAIRVAPVISDVLAKLADLPSALIARMSGSGATCFALFSCPEAARHGADLLAGAHPDWWVAAARLGDAKVVAGAEV